MWKKHASTREFWAEVCWPLVARVQPPGSGLCWLHSALKSARSAITLCFTNFLKAHCGNWANFLLLYQNTDMKICLIPNNAKAALGPSSRLFVRWDDDLKPVLSSFAMHSTGFPQEQCSHGVTDKCTGSTWGQRSNRNQRVREVWTRERGAPVRSTSFRKDTSEHTL